MARLCKLLGAALSVLGVALILTFGVIIARDADYRRAELAAARNAGNVMYETEYGVARVRRGFEVVGVLVGILLALNGGTLLGLGVVAEKMARPTSAP